MPALLLVRYGELALKSPPVRREFETALRRNLVGQFLNAGLALRLRSDRGHIYAEADDGPSAVRLARRVFGVTSVSVVDEVPTDRPTITRRLLELADARLPPRARFAVRARRTGSHPFTSQELARDLGSDILTRWPERSLQVDLTHPEVELFVEVRGPRTYLYFDRQSGPGGVPLGVAGRLVAVVDGPRGALGAYLMMKRGCRVALVTPPSGESLVRDVLLRFDPEARVEASSSDPGEYLPRVHAVVEATHADGVVLPIAVDDYPAARDTWQTTLVFSPTVGLSDEEVTGRWSGVVELAS
jgi:thiamine biosynthesis protein ThiI